MNDLEHKVNDACSIVIFFWRGYETKAKKDMLQK